MQITVKDGLNSKVAPALQVTALFTDKKGLPARIPAAALADFDGKARSLVVSYGTGKPERVGLLGLGDRDELDAETVRRAAAVVEHRARALEVSEYAIDWSQALSALDPETIGQAAAEGVCLAAYSFEEFKGKEGKRSKAKSGKRKATFAGKGAPFRRGIKAGQATAAGACLVRDLGNSPGNGMTPTMLAARARKIATGHPRISCKVMSEAEMKRMKMGSLLGVSRGSREPAKLIHLTYKPKGRSKGRVAVVGKGLTFDTGGISIKPSRGMDEMKFDMCGGGAVLGLFRALRDTDLPFEIHGIVPSSENMPGENAQKPGDVVTAMNGTTIEVLNTDAEGRLILADALVYASKRVKPQVMVDLATLTGAVVMALGHEATGIMGDRELCAELVDAGESSGERCWELPLWDAHRDQMKSETADLRNINSPADGSGSTAGGAFLSYFVDEDIRWAHLDIAGTAWGGRNRDYYAGKGASGVGVRLLVQWLRARASS